MNKAIKSGLSFGITSGVITTLGLMVGLGTSTKSEIAVIGGILTIAITDALSDSLGVHISQESENHRTSREIWQATLSTLGFKFLFALTFLVPVLIFTLPLAILVSIGWGLSLICVLSYFIAKQNSQSALKVILEHISVAIIVIALTSLIGTWLNSLFNGVQLSG